MPSVEAKSSLGVAHPLAPSRTEDEIAGGEDADRLALPNPDGRPAVAVTLDRGRGGALPPPTITVLDAPPLASVLAPPRIDSRIAEPKREKKWLLTWPPMPAWPEKSPAGEASAIETPSGRTKPRPHQIGATLPRRLAALYSPIRRDERGIRTRLPSNERTSWLTTARTIARHVAIDRRLEHRRDQRSLHDGARRDRRAWSNARSRLSPIDAAARSRARQHCGRTVGIARRVRAGRRRSRSGQRRRHRPGPARTAGGMPGTAHRPWHMAPCPASDSVAAVIGAAGMGIPAIGLPAIGPGIGSACWPVGRETAVDRAGRRRRMPA